MPLERFLKILLSGLFALAIVFVVAVQYSGIQPASDIQSLAAYEQIAKEYFNYARTCAWTLMMRTTEWFEGLSHDDLLTFSTVLIAVFTASLWWSTRRLWKAGERQIRLARDEFNATHRPRVSVRRMGTVFFPNEPIKIEFTIVNTGDAAITGFSCNTIILYLKGIGAIHGIPIFDPDTASTSDASLQIGEGKNILVLEAANLDPKQLKDITSGSEILHLIGYVVYRDKVGTTRRTGFFRYYDRERRRFRVIDDPEYEYQD
jgi:hypothetical protein